MKNLNITARAALSAWFPLLQRSGVPVPETRIITTDLPLYHLIDEGQAVPGLETLIAELRQAAVELGGFPVFLRTGHGSGKHQWRQTCHVPSEEKLVQHVSALVEWSEIVDPLGLPTEEWVVRRLLPLHSSFTAFSGFPVNVERRYFINEGKVLCAHPYWPKGAVAEGRPSDPEWETKLEEMNHESTQERILLTDLSLKVAAEFLGTGSWSLDWALSEDGIWYAIDMAPAVRSFHWAGCPVSFTEPQ